MGPRKAGILLGVFVLAVAVGTGPLVTGCGFLLRDAGPADATTPKPGEEPAVVASSGEDSAAGVTSGFEATGAPRRAEVRRVGAR